MFIQSTVHFRSVLFILRSTESETHSSPNFDNPPRAYVHIVQGTLEIKEQSLRKSISTCS